MLALGVEFGVVLEGWPESVLGIDVHDGSIRLEHPFGGRRSEQLSGDESSLGDHVLILVHLGVEELDEFVAIFCVFVFVADSSSASGVTLLLLTVAVSGGSIAVSS